MSEQDLGIESNAFPKRMRAGVSLAWRIFARKVAEGLILVHKEASMQLQFAYVLQQLLPLLVFHPDETFSIELETGVKLNKRSYEVDVLMKGASKAGSYRIAIELKCYRTMAASGDPRGATDIFMKDVYEDLAMTELYVDHDVAEEGIVLVMNDLKRLVHPAQKTAKCWDYDISHGAAFGPILLTTKVGSKPVRIELKRSYALDWNHQGAFWFLEAQGVLPPAAASSPVGASPTLAAA